MKCSFCGVKNSKVVDSRSSNEGNSIRRRRECIKCNKRFTTYEYVETVPLRVVKKDGSRELFDRQKIISGLLKACEKRPVSMEKINSVVSSIERIIMRKFDKEVSSNEIGEMVIQQLAKLDDVAYVRFASVYRQFKDVNQFMRELKGILGKEQ